MGKEEGRSWCVVGLQMKLFAGKHCFHNASCELLKWQPGRLTPGW